MAALNVLDDFMRARTSPNVEYLLQGSVLDTAVEQLILVLEIVCDNVDSTPETFHDLEVCLAMRQPNQRIPLSVRVRRSLDRDTPFQLRYIGQPQIDQRRPTITRTNIDIACSPTILEFLIELGFRLDFEYITKGFVFRKGRMKITISKLFKIVPGKQQDMGNEPISQSHLVELSVICPTAGQDKVADEMRAFAMYLKPIVQLEKLDCKRVGF